MAPDVRLRIIEDKPVRLRISGGIVVEHGGLPTYEGPYEVTPSVSEQTLSTNEKVMDDDVTVHEISYITASNPAGGLTVSIAS